MLYGTREYKNGKVKGILEFDTGKIVKLNEKENKELNEKIELWKWEAIVKERTKNK